VLAVLDTNVLLSGLRTETSAPALILNSWIAGTFRIATSAEQVEEFKRAARYPKLRRTLPRAAVGKLVNRLYAAEVVLERLRRFGDSPDPGDDYLLAMAVAAEADYLVTGDKALLSLEQTAGTRIVTPRRFASLLRS
jgi:hypothetical protein